MVRYWIFSALVLCTGCAAVGEFLASPEGQAVKEDAQERVPDLIENAASGNWLGVAIGGVTVVAGAIVGFLKYKGRKKAQ
jgi:hypothetical protein